MDRSLLERAYDFAERAHTGQKRESGAPYFTHPFEVAMILVSFKLDTASIVTGLLHDTVEDTGVTLSDIEKNFGKDITFLVDSVTKLIHVEARSDKVKQAEKFRKLFLAMSSDIRVLLIKLADCLHNMRTLNHIHSEEKRKRVARETIDIYVPLAERIGLSELMEELEDICFSELNPDVRNSILSRLNFLRLSGQDILAPILEELRTLLSSNNIPAQVMGREKTPYSIWKKMQRKNIPFEQLSDIIAFRICVDSIPQCYEALGLLHSAYSVIPSRFKDYISVPKQNGYRSLHTAIYGPLNRRIEIQIRTHQMEQVADFGVAAHWQYKQGKLPHSSQYRWIRGLLDILEHSSNPEEFLDHTKLEMFQDQVFCFTPKGDLITLPVGATPVDFAYAVHSKIGDQCVGAKVNGKNVPLRSTLSNGDQVEIKTSKNQNPSATWENFVTTGKARLQIRRFVRQQQQDEFIKLGRSILEKKFKAIKQPFPGKPLLSHLKELGYSTPEQLYAKVGEGTASAESIIRRIFPDIPDIRSPEKLDLPSTPVLFKEDENTTSIDPDLGIQGLPMGSIPQLAQCCHPLPGDVIVGAVTQKNELLIHRKTCENVTKKNFSPDKVVDLSWIPPEKDQTYIARIQTTIVDKPGSLATLTGLIGQSGSNITNIQLQTQSPEVFEFLIDLYVHNAKQLNEIIGTLRMSSSILSVDRCYRKV